MLVEFICLFFPAVLCVCIYEKLNKCTLNRRQWAYHFILDALFINLFCFLIKTFVLGSGGQQLLYDGVNMTPHAALNYLIITIPSAVALAVVSTLLFKNVRFEVEDDADEK